LKQVPGVLEAVILGVPQLSVTVGTVQVALEQLSVVFKTMLAGQFRMVGLVKSVKHGFVTVTLKAHVPMLLFASFAV
jgi:hypothetical protein